MKTVYILGAGFSVDAGAPVQARIVPEAFRLMNEQPTDSFDPDKFKVFTDFLSKQLNIHEDNFSEIALEDIFTPLDRCLGESTQYRGVSLDSIMATRESVFYVVGRTIQLLLNEASKPKDYINNFAKYLASQSSIRQNKEYRKQDPVSVISTNWDILLDNSINEVIRNEKYNAVVDYCCYISSKDEDKSDKNRDVMPGLEKLGEGGFNIKLLKLHGSLNWLQCPRCARMYAKFSEKIGINKIPMVDSCSHCDRNFPEEKGNHTLAPNLIMPTFLKDLSNPQYKIIWQNAGIEISEADKIVFIGYSLPSADFDMRLLLSRMTRKNARIHVVDYCTSNETSHLERHWKSFFGDRKISFEFNGAKEFINKLVGQH